MKKRNHICDVNGCGRQRERWQRICPRCFALRPGAVSRALILAFRSRDHAAWRQRRAEAGRLLGDGLAANGRRLMERPRCPGRNPNPSMRAEAIAMMNRILGERPDA